MTVSFVAALYKLDDFHTHNKLSSNLISGNVKDRKERKRNKEIKREILNKQLFQCCGNRRQIQTELFPILNTQQPDTVLVDFALSTQMYSRMRR